LAWGCCVVYSVCVYILYMLGGLIVIGVMMLVRVVFLVFFTVYVLVAKNGF